MTRALTAGLLALSVALSLNARADESTLASANVAARWLNLPAGARVSSMGGAFAAVADDVNSLVLNPAGLSQMNGAEAAFTHNLGLEGSSQDRLMGALPAGAWGGFGVGIDYVSFGPVERFSIDSLGVPVSKGTYTPYGATVGLAWGKALMGGLAAGVGVKAVVESLNQDMASTYAVDLGLLWQAPVQGLAFGASVVDLGSPLQGNDLPLKIRGGLAYRATMGLPLRLAADIVAAPRDGEAPLEVAGLELQPAQHFWLRGGYQLGNANNPSGPTVGLGLSDYGPVSVDYAFNAIGNLGATQQVSLRVNFNAPLAASTVAPEAAVAPVLTPTPLPAVAQAELDAKVNTFVLQLKQANYQDVAQRGEALRQAAPEQAKQVLQQTRVEAVQPAVFEGRYEEVVKSLEAMRSLNPKDSYVEEALGMMDWRQGKFDSARQHFFNASELDHSLDYLNRWSKEPGR